MRAVQDVAAGARSDAGEADNVDNDEVIRSYYAAVEKLGPLVRVSVSDMISHLTAALNVKPAQPAGTTTPHLLFNNTAVRFKDTTVRVRVAIVDGGANIFTITTPVWDALIKALPENHRKKLQATVEPSTSRGVFGEGNAVSAKAQAALHCVIAPGTPYEASLNHTSMMVVMPSTGFGMLVPTDWMLAYNGYVVPQDSQLHYTIDTDDGQKHARRHQHRVRKR
ncbi:hypothetical protein RI054_43g152420 [Pseudoscourfieldia marina]